MSKPEAEIAQLKAQLKQQVAKREEEISGTVIELNSKWKSGLENHLQVINEGLVTMGEIDPEVSPSVNQKLLHFAQGLMQSQANLVEVMKRANEFEKDCHRKFGDAIEDLQNAVNELHKFV